MDAYDLFKNLSKGTKLNFKKFRTEIDASKKEDPVKIEKENKDEDEPTEEVPKLSEKRKCETLEEEDHDDNFTIMTGINVSKDGKKKKNKKAKKELTEDKIKMLDQEKINHFRNVHNISVTGKRVPKPIENFDELLNRYEIGQDLVENLKNSKYESPTPIQMQAIPLMLENRQMLACAPTGSGKTAAFLLPIIHHLKGPQKQGFRAVIISPTRELAKQTYRECLKLSEGRNFRVHIISKVNQALEKYGPKSSQKFDILITTPQRVEFLLRQEPPAISLNNVEWLVIDEADKLFEEGTRGFREQLIEICSKCTNPELKQVMFSATSTPAVAKWCRQQLKDLVTVTVGHRNAAASLVDQEILFVGNEGGKLIAFRNIVQKGLSPPVLVFVQSKERAQALFNELLYDGIMVDVIHADRTQTQRDNVVRCFREGKIWVLICTELMGRGIDFKGVNLVINYDFPPSAISYIHRIGRTGRAGHKGKAITFFTRNDTTNLRSIASVMKNSGCEVPDYMLTMKKPNKKELKRKIHESAAKNKANKSLLVVKKKNTNYINRKLIPTTILQKNNNQGDNKKRKVVKKKPKQKKTNPKES